MSDPVTEPTPAASNNTETILIISVCVICACIVFINSEWFQSQVASRFYPFQIENKTTEILHYRYENPKTKEEVTGTLLGGEKHVDHDLKAYDKFKVEIRSEDPNLEDHGWNSREVGRDARRVSIVADEAHLGNLRNSVLKPVEMC